MLVKTDKTPVILLPENRLTETVINGISERSLIEWVREQMLVWTKDKVFLDIGAHTGTYSLLLNNMCNHVYAFEPQKSTYYALCGGVALSGAQNITCWNFGLGSVAQAGYKQLNIISEDGGGSTINHVSYPIAIETIEVRTLDMCRGFIKGKIGFIKMDVEGNELEVLKGAQQTLRENELPPILFEENGDVTAIKEFLKNTLNYKEVLQINGYSNMYLAIH